MCGIFGLVQKYAIKSDYSSYLKNLQKRGPDQTNYMKFKHTSIGFTRLSIMQLDESGMQPYVFDTETGHIVFICNGEIYNFKEIAQQYQLEGYKDIQINNRDCIVIPLLYMKLGSKAFCELFANQIKGEFAFSIFEFDSFQNVRNIILGRDLLGIRPLYVSTQSNDMYNIVFSSSIDSLSFYAGKIKHFEPGTIQFFQFERVPQTNIKDSSSLKVYISKHEIFRFDQIYKEIIQIKKEQEYLQDIRNSLINAVKIRLNSDQPICFLLSGGLDSSLVCSIAQSLLKTPIYTFCCGISERGEKANTNDILNARKVAEHIGSIHTEVTFTREEALNVIPEVIRNIGTWCQTTIRASTPMYLLCKYIRENTNFRVVFSGEVSDELFSGYLYNYELQKDEYIDISSKLMVRNIHKYDVLRADACISQNSLESRVPFSDQDVIRSAWQIPSHLRHPRYKDCEKYWLRQAFNIDCQQSYRQPNGQHEVNLSSLPQDQSRSYLPQDVLFRTKVAFSNSIADKSEKTWIQSIKEFCIDRGTTELEYYLQLFKQHFGNNRVSILDQHWQPSRFDENGNIITDFIDSSAEALDIYKIKFKTS